VLLAVSPLRITECMKKKETTQSQSPTHAIVDYIRRNNKQQKKKNETLINISNPFFEIQILPRARAKDKNSK